MSPPKSLKVTKVDNDTFALRRETLRRFVDDELIPAEDRIEADDDIPASIVQSLRELGVFGISIPERYGGLGMGMLEEALLIQEIGRASLAFRSLIGTNIGIGSQGIIIDGTEAQKQEWLPRLASGEVIASFALTEPGAGSDAASITTRADLGWRRLSHQWRQTIYHQRDKSGRVHGHGAHRA